MSKKDIIYPIYKIHRDPISNHVVMKETIHEDGEKEYEDLRERPEFTYEDLLKASTNPALIDFVMKDEKGEPLFEQVEDIVVLGQTRQVYKMKPFAGKTLKTKLKNLQEHCTFADIEAAKGTRKSVPLQMLVAWVHYNFHYDSVVVAAQTIGLTNKWHDQFMEEGLGFIYSNTGVDIREWFHVAGSVVSDIKLAGNFYLNYPQKHPESKIQNKQIIFKAHNNPNGWTNIKPKFREGRIWLVIQEEPVRIKTSSADAEPLSYEVIEANEDIVLNNVSRHCEDHGYPFIVASAFNANDPKNKRIKRNLKLHKPRIEWMREDPINNHTSRSYHKDEKNGKGIKILRQSKLSADINPLAKAALADRIKRGLLTRTEEMTILGVPLQLDDPTLSKTYNDPIEPEDLVEEFDTTGKTIMYVHGGMDFDFNRESRFHIAIMYGINDTGEIGRYHYHMKTPEEWEDVPSQIERSRLYGEWFENSIRDFIKICEELSPEEVPYIFGDDDGRTNLRLAMNIKEFNELLMNDELRWQPYFKHYGKKRALENTDLSEQIFHADIRNRVMFTNWVLTRDNELFDKSCEQLMEEIGDCSSKLNKKTGMYERVEDHDKQNLNGINAMEAAESLQREMFDLEFYHYEKTRYYDNEGKQRYETEII